MVNNWYLVMSTKEIIIKADSGWKGNTDIGDPNMFLEEVGP